MCVNKKTKTYLMFAALLETDGYDVVFFRAVGARLVEGIGPVLFAMIFGALARFKDSKTSSSLGCCTVSIVSTRSCGPAPSPKLFIRDEALGLPVSFSDKSTVGGGVFGGGVMT